MTATGRSKRAPIHTSPFFGVAAWGRQNVYFVFPSIALRAPLLLVCAPLEIRAALVLEGGSAGECNSTVSVPVAANFTFSLPASINFTFTAFKEKVGTAGRHPQDWAFVTLHHVCEIRAWVDFGPEYERVYSGPG